MLESKMETIEYESLETLVQLKICACKFSILILYDTPSYIQRPPNAGSTKI